MIFKLANALILGSWSFELNLFASCYSVFISWQCCEKRPYGKNRISLVILLTRPLCSTTVFIPDVAIEVDLKWIIFITWVNLYLLSLWSLLCISVFFQVRNFKLEQEQEKNKILSEALATLATEHHELEQSLVKGSPPLSILSEDEFYDALSGNSRTLPSVLLVIHSWPPKCLLRVDVTLSFLK